VQKYLKCLQFITLYNYWTLPNPVAVRSKAWKCGRLLAGIADVNPVGGFDTRL